MHGDRKPRLVPGRTPNVEGRRGALDAWWQKALVSAVVLIAAATVAWSVRVWMVERAFDHMQKSVLESTAKIQRQAQAASERLLADQRRQQWPMPTVSARGPIGRR